MKKLMFAAAVAAGFAAFGEGLESSNTVGFNTKAVEAAKFYILGVQFEATDGTMDINKLVTGFTGESQLQNENFTATAPQIQIPNSTTGGYDVYYYLVDGWYDNGTEDGDFKPGWCDSNGVIAGDAESDLDGVIPAGVGMWVKDVLNSENFQQAGQVPADSSVAVSAPANFTLRTNPFPIAFNLNDSTKVTCANLTAGDIEDDDFTSKASQIQVPNATTGGYDVYYYLSNGWYDNGTEDGDFKPGWCDSNGVIAGDAEADLDGNITAGQGFWTKGVGATFTMTFTK